MTPDCSPHEDRSLSAPDSARDRKKIETLFGDVKRNLALTFSVAPSGPHVLSRTRPIRLRGLSGARDEFC